ncbi:MAG: VWA domain-containing protein, partial [Alphaproteobacteria bacterium]|nr:VWA domain-containing protein [Alphaproteobacteria bacterium]
FHLFWRNPRILERMMAMVLPEFRGGTDAEEADISRRVAEALQQGKQGQDKPQESEDELVIDASMTWSSQEVLQTRDFDKMSAAEQAEAKRAMTQLRLPIADIPTRRFRPDPRGSRADPRATLRAALRGGADIIDLKRRRRRLRPPPLVALCDISGSMGRYSRMLLHFLHTLTNDRDRVFTFLFGTRLTHVTRHLRRRDVDEALDRVAGAAEDWSGGTRIGHCIDEFNRHWSRRVLAQGAIVLMISDGLDRDAGEGLGWAMERLHKSCRRLIWLNPLLRYAGFEPKSLGIKAILPHVDDFRTVHNLASLTELAAELSRPGLRRAEGVTTWQGPMKEAV